MPRPDRPRPGHVVIVAGTGTDVGKTFVARLLIEHWKRQDHSVAARKPAQSFTPALRPTDADILAAATGEDAAAVCPLHRWYAVPMAPPMAAEVLHEPPFTISDLLAELTWPAAVDIGLIETAGGVCSPLAADGDCATLIAAVEPDLVVLVADAGLGTIHAVRSSVAAVAAAADVPVTAFLNRYDTHAPLHRLNRAWLTDRYGLRVTTEIPEVTLMD
jgi:dethiobiotin synthetase